MFTCTKCSKEFKHKRALQRHVNHLTCERQGRKQGGSFVCSHCQKSFTRNDALTRHTAEFHQMEGGAQRYECPIVGCKRTFSRVKYIQSHVNAIHKRIRLHNCLYCAHTFYTAWNCRRHETICKTWTDATRKAYERHHLQFIEMYGDRFSPQESDTILLLSDEEGGGAEGEEEDVEELDSLDSGRTIMDHLYSMNTTRTIYTPSNQTLTVASVCTLGKYQWVNDEAVNAYMITCAMRNPDSQGRRFLVFDSFFYEDLAVHANGTYRYLSRYTASHSIANLFDSTKYRWIFIPINIQRVHWSLVVVDLVNQHVFYLDSLGNDGSSIMNHIVHFIRDEAVVKGVTFNGNWTQISMYRTIPQQPNEYDCAIYTCTYAHEWMSALAKRDVLPKSFRFTPQEIPHIRDQMMADLYHGNIPAERSFTNV